MTKRMAGIQPLFNICHTAIDQEMSNHTVTGCKNAIAYLSSWLTACLAQLFNCCLMCCCRYGWVYYFCALL